MWFATLHIGYQSRRLLFVAVELTMVWLMAVVCLQAKQEPNEFIVLNSGAYHSGYNLGFNCAEAVNFATQVSPSVRGGGADWGEPGVALAGGGLKGSTDWWPGGRGTTSKRGQFQASGSNVSLCVSCMLLEHAA